jgi:hypothetical protein
MIRIETTADFDAEGRFTLQGQSAVPVTPGKHRVTVVISEADASTVAEPVIVEGADDQMLQRINGVLVWTGQLLEDPETTRERLDDERTDQLLYGCDP